MFSGIVETICPVRAVERGADRRRLAVDLSPLRAPSGHDPRRPGREAGPGPAAVADEGRGEAPCRPGDSVAINGVCLTVAELRGPVAAFDVVTETLGRSNLGELRAGDLVNVERALRFGERVDGHLVQGHVEATGTIEALDVQPGQTWLTVACDAPFAARCLPKGSVAVDGVSLTVAELGADRFSAALVPHTLQRTVFGRRAVGDRVNLEPDMIGQWVLAAVARTGR